MTRAISICLLAAACLGLSACNDTTVSSQHAEVGSLRFDVPTGWKPSTMTEHGLLTGVWTPSPTANARKESIAIMRTERSPLVATAGASALEPLLTRAQKALPDAKLSPIVPVKTRHGLRGFRIDVDYVPAGSHEHYHRVHVVLLDGKALVHVLYTARDPDARRAVLDEVLDTIREGEA